MPLEAPQSAPQARATERKDVLFCPECWHDNPVDGDWRVQAKSDGDIYCCPVCGATVTTRPPTTAKDASRISTTPAYDAFLACSLGALSAWMDVAMYVPGRTTRDSCCRS